MSKLPAPGTEAFKKLPLNEQLEIVKLQIFSPDTYKAVVAPSKRKENQLVVEEKLDLPPNRKLTQETISQAPITFIDSYWCGYKSNYKECWYIEDISSGLSGSDLFNLDYKRQGGIDLFNFPLISMSRTAHTLYQWIYSSNPITTATALLETCKFLAYIEEHGNLSCTYDDVVDDTVLITHFSSVNDSHFVFDFPEDVDTLLECDYLCILPLPKMKADIKGHYFYPVLPNFLYLNLAFMITNWGFLE